MGTEFTEPTPSIEDLKSEFISTVSHELRTPLTAIGGYVRLIRDGDAGPVTDTQHEFLSIIETNVQRLTHLINDILDLERLDIGAAARLEVQQEPQDLSEILRECRDNLILTAAHKGLEFKLELPERLPFILGERGRLVQIFNNLISNAIKYTRTGFVEARVSSENDCLSVQVRDSGIGISSEDQAKLFQRFYRTDSSLATRERGTGLGLVITRGLIEAHGGTISVRSQVDQGSTFEVKFPITTPTVSIGDVARENEGELIRAIHQVEESRLAARDAIRARGLRVLVADANVDFRILIKRSLEQRGFEVDDVDRGKLVIARLEQTRYDLLLMDQKFPDVAGTELLRTIRKRNQYTDLPVFLLTDENEDLSIPLVGRERGIDGIVDLVTEGIS